LLCLDWSSSDPEPLQILTIKIKCKKMKSTTTAAEQQDPRLQQVRICSNATAIVAEIKEKNLLTFRRPQVGRDLYCQHFNKFWEAVDPGSTPSGHPGSLLTPEVPTFLPGAQSLFQAVT